MTGAKLSTGLRWPMLLGFVSLLVLVGGFGSWATFSSLSGAIIASGQIEVEKNRQVVQHPDGGVVAKILVKEGDFIQRDAVLVRLDPIAEQSEMSIIEGQLFEMMARDGELERLHPGLTLIPGMPVEAFIRTAARSPLNYFLKPLSNYFICAFRET